MNLQEEGFIFVERTHKFMWVHPANKLPSDTDCTDMTDEEFERVVLSIRKEVTA